MPAKHPLFGASAQGVQLGAHGEATVFEDVFIVDGKRTPFGEFSGALRGRNEKQLFATAAQGLLDATGVPANIVRSVIIGNVIPSSTQVPYAARNTVLEPNDGQGGGIGGAVGTTAKMINDVCASSLSAIHDAAVKIGITKDTDQDIMVLAGGTESMSNAPFSSFKLMQRFQHLGDQAKKANLFTALPLLWRYRQTKKDVQQALGKDIERAIAQVSGKKAGNPSSWDFRYTLYEGLRHDLVKRNMMETGDDLAQEYRLTNKELDEYSARSQHNAGMAILEGKLKDEIVPVKDETGKVLLAEDEGVRGLSVKVESLAKLRRRSGGGKKGGMLTTLGKMTGLIKRSERPTEPTLEKAVNTAGNASRITDGAAAVLVSNKETLERLGKTPLARIVSIGKVGVDPDLMGRGAAEAAKAALLGAQKKGVNIQFSDIDRFEINEAFASVAVATMKDWSATYNVPYDALLRKTNVKGGAIALGHPLAASGARIVTTLAKDLQRENLRYGLATLCMGGGQGMAIIVENPKWKPPSA